MQRRLEHVAYRARIRLLVQTITATRRLLAKHDGRLCEGFSYPVLHDALADTETIYAVRWHDVSLGELMLDLEPDALGGSGWTFLPAAPIALPGRVVLPVGPSPDTESKLEWLQTVLDPAALQQARAETAGLCEQQLHLGIEHGAKAWLEALEQGELLREVAAAEEPALSGAAI